MKKEESMSREQHPNVSRRVMGRWAFVALLAAACSGSAGQAGSPGKNGTNGDAGTSCTVTDNKDGTAKIACTDGTSVVVQNGTNGTNGTNGMNGISCTLASTDGGARTLSCGDAGVITVVDAVVDFNQLTMIEKSEAAMSAAVTDVAIPADGRPLVTIKVS